jgi:hypothetical protein
VYNYTHAHIRVDGASISDFVLDPKRLGTTLPGSTCYYVMTSFAINEKRYYPFTNLLHTISHM